MNHMIQVYKIHNYLLFEEKRESINNDSYYSYYW